MLLEVCLLCGRLNHLHLLLLGALRTIEHLLGHCNILLRLLLHDLLHLLLLLGGRDHANG